MKELNGKSNNKSQIKDKILVLGGKKTAFELERQVFILLGLKRQNEELGGLSNPLQITGLCLQGWTGA